jgi:hypothetical protein
LHFPEASRIPIPPEKKHGVVEGKDRARWHPLRGGAAHHFDRPAPGQNGNSLQVGSDLFLGEALEISRVQPAQVLVNQERVLAPGGATQGVQKGRLPWSKHTRSPPNEQMRRAFMGAWGPRYS